MANTSTHLLVLDASPSGSTTPILYAWNKSNLAIDNSLETEISGLPGAAGMASDSTTIWISTSNSTGRVLQAYWQNPPTIDLEAEFVSGPSSLAVEAGTVDTLVPVEAEFVSGASSLAVEASIDSDDLVGVEAEFDSGSSSLSAEVSAVYPRRWSVPVVIAQDGIDGAGGVDGQGIEFIYAVTRTDAAIGSSQLPDNAWAYDSPVEIGGLQWSDGAPALTVQNRFLWVSTRRVPGQPAMGTARPAAGEPNQWSDWSTPAILSRYPEDALGVEEIWAVTNGDTPSDPDNDWGYDQPESPWFDTPPGITAANNTLWRSQRKLSGSPDAGDSVSADWSTPVIAGTFGEGGEDGQGLEVIFARTATDTAPSNPDNDWGYDRPQSPWFDGLPTLSAQMPFGWRSQRAVVGSPAAGDAVAADWSTPSIAARFGADGATTEMYLLYRRHNAAGGPPEATGTYSNGTFTPPANWVLDPPLQTDPKTPLWGMFNAVNTDTDDVTSLGVFRLDGDDGLKGDDAAGREYIFAAFNSVTLPASKRPDNDWFFDQPQTADGLRWHDGAPELTADNPYLFRSERKITGDPLPGLTISDSWSTPVVVGHFGADGEPAMGREITRRWRTTEATLGTDGIHISGTAMRITPGSDEAVLRAMPSGAVLWFKQAGNIYSYRIASAPSFHTGFILWTVERLGDEPTIAAGTELELNLTYSQGERGLNAAAYAVTRTYRGASLDGIMASGDFKMRQDGMGFQIGAVTNSDDDNFLRSVLVGSYIWITSGLFRVDARVTAIARVLTTDPTRVVHTFTTVSDPEIRYGIGASLGDDIEIFFTSARSRKGDKGDKGDDGDPGAPGQPGGGGSYVRTQLFQGELDLSQSYDPEPLALANWQNHHVLEFRVETSGIVLAHWAPVPAIQAASLAQPTLNDPATEGRSTISGAVAPSDLRMFGLAFRGQQSDGFDLLGTQLARAATTGDPRPEGNNLVYALNPSNGQIKIVSSTGAGVTFIEWVSGVLYGIRESTGMDELWRIFPGAASKVGDLFDANNQPAGLALHSGTLYTIDQNNRPPGMPDPTPYTGNRLYSVNTATGAATLVTTVTGLPVPPTGMFSNGSELYVHAGGRLYSVNLTTGVTTEASVLGESFFSDLAWHSQMSKAFGFSEVQASPPVQDLATLDFPTPFIAGTPPYTGSLAATAQSYMMAGHGAAGSSPIYSVGGGRIYRLDSSNVVTSKLLRFRVPVPGGSPVTVNSSDHDALGFTLAYESSTGNLEIIANLPIIGSMGSFTEAGIYRFTIESDDLTNWAGSVLVSELGVRLSSRGSVNDLLCAFWDANGHNVIYDPAGSSSSRIARVTDSGLVTQSSIASLEPEGCALANTDIIAAVGNVFYSVNPVSGAARRLGSSGAPDASYSVARRGGDYFLIPETLGAVYRASFVYTEGSGTPDTLATPGGVTVIGRIGIPAALARTTGFVASASINNVLYLLEADGTLEQVTLATGDLNPAVVGETSETNVVAMTSHQSLLYAFREMTGANRLISISPEDGTVTELGTAGNLSSVSNVKAMAAEGGELYIVTSTGLWKYDLEDNTSAQVGSNFSDISDPLGAAFVHGSLFVSTGSGDSHELYVVGIQDASERSLGEIGALDLEDLFPLAIGNLAHLAGRGSDNLVYRVLLGSEGEEYAFRGRYASRRDANSLIYGATSIHAIPVGGGFVDPGEETLTVTGITF